ncbi:MAG: alpha/beta fold hydrolase [Flavipsychrobacter sp.]|nr:alpha/beta fold hydrolase [Flavipsychrobacter sp.]
MKVQLVAACMALSLTAVAQSKLTGNWEGEMNVGQKVRLVFRVTEANGKLSTIMDSPDQGVTGIPVAGTTMNGDSVLFDLSNAGIQYSGLLKGESIDGVWKQNGMKLPLVMKKTDKPAELRRPQTPKPPFGYLSEDVTFKNADGSISYGATITMPAGGKTYPAVLLISGSGPQNRDEELMGHKPFAVLADYLTKKGYVVLRVDDRGVAQTTGDRKKATSADFAKDANAAIDYLKTRKEVNVKKIGMLGHSEGGMIAPMVAADRKDIDFVVLMAGPGVKIYELMEDQSAAMMLAGGVSENIVAEYRKLYRGIEQAVISSSTGEEAKNKMIQVTTTWKSTATKDAIALVDIDDFEKEKKFIDEFMRMYHDAWFNYFLKYDPQPVLQKLNCKVLALNGEKDMQVLSKANLDGIKQSLAKSKTKMYDVKELPGLNHLFQTCKVCTVQEYGVLEETISPTALTAISDWLDKKVK